MLVKHVKKLITKENKDAAKFQWINYSNKREKKYSKKINNKREQKCWERHIFDFVAEIASLKLVENDIVRKSLWRWGLLGEDFLTDQSPNDAKGRDDEGHRRNEKQQQQQQPQKQQTVEAPPQPSLEELVRQMTMQNM